MEGDHDLLVSRHDRHLKLIVYLLEHLYFRARSSGREPRATFRRFAESTVTMFALAAYTMRYCARGGGNKMNVILTQLTSSSTIK
jgi:hypothetical protein